MSKKLHLGSGGMVLDGYLNTDLDDLPGVDLKLDAARVPYLFENIVFDEVFSGHMLEHIDPKLVPGMIKEWYRILKPGGRVICEVPDFDEAHRLFDAGKYTRQKFLELIYGNSERPGQHHQWAWSYETLEPLFLRAGFTKLSKEPSQDYHWISFQIPTFRLEAVK